MKLDVIAFGLSLAAMATAQSLDSLPSCAKECLTDAVAKSTSCSPTDLACVCKNFEAIQGAATGCVLSSCGADVALNEVLPATKELCSDVDTSGVPGGSDTPQTSDSPSATVLPPEASSTQPPAPPEGSPTQPPAGTTTGAPVVPTGGAMGTKPVSGFVMVAAAAAALAL